MSRHQDDNNNYHSLVIVNPASAAGRTGRDWKKIETALRMHLPEFDATFTCRPEHATDLSREGIDKGYEMIVAVGGDGTLSEVANGFFEGQEARASTTVLGFIPHGTGGDFRRMLYPSIDWRQICGNLKGRDYKMIDLGHVQFRDHHGNDAERIFINVASFGCGGAVSQAVRKSTKRLGGRLTFMLVTAKTLSRYRDQTASISVDREPSVTQSITNYAVCNGGFFGGGIQVAPHAALTNGAFALTSWAGFGLRDFVFKQKSLFNGRHTDDQRTTTATAKSVTANSEQTVLLDLDGENPGCLPASFQILPSCLRLKI